MSSTETLFELLSDVLPIFITLVDSYSQSNNGIATEDLDSLEEGFYSSLQNQLVELRMHLCDRPTSLGARLITLDESLKKVLYVLDRRFTKTASQNIASTKGVYPRLRDLQKQIPARNWTTRELRDRIVLKDPRKAYRKHMIDRLDSLNSDLAEIGKKIPRRSKDVAASRRSALDRSKSVKITQSYPSAHVRGDARVLHEALTAGWNCNSHDVHVMMLRLAPHRIESGGTRFNIFLGTDVEQALQESEVHIITAAKHVLATHPIVRIVDPLPHRRSNPSRPGKTVSFDIDKSSTCSNPGPDATPILIPVESICAIVQELSQSIGWACRLKLVVQSKQHGKSLWKQQDCGASVDKPRAQSRVTFGDLLGNTESNMFKKIRKLNRCRFQVLLANSFLHLYRSHWFINDTIKEHICFYQSEWQPLTAMPDITRPYISAFFRNMNCEVEDDVRRILHPLPGILALGISLLEIELGVSIEYFHKNHPMGNLTNDRNNRSAADRIMAFEMLKCCRDDSSFDFIDAVTACLEVETFEDVLRVDASFENPYLLSSIYEKVVAPLENVLNTIYREDVMTLERNIAKPLASTTSSGFVFIRDLPTPPSAPVPHIPPIEPRIVMPQINESLVAHLFDNEDEFGTIDKTLCIGADDWLDELYRKVARPLLGEKGKQTRRASGNVFPREGPVRIAILDTGIALSKDGGVLYGSRVKFKSWLKHATTLGMDSEEEPSDYDGHGTHAAGLLLQVAPAAEIFVAQVFKDRKEARQTDVIEEIHERIAAAIIYAAEDWDVDIISMSFGFKLSVPVIDKAIKLADSKHVIMVAAASNYGGNADISWPARHNDVLCIYATDNLGNRCRFTPTGTDGKNFAVLGQAVNSYWPSQSMPEVRKSGTSTATPIAAGIAAIVLDYIRIAIDKWDHDLTDIQAETFRKIRTTAGMKTVFTRMAPRKREGYNYVVPWEFFCNGYPNPEMAICNVVLGDLFQI